jgi:peptide subunit release factor 1 (eRF1)
MAVAGRARRGHEREQVFRDDQTTTGANMTELDGTLSELARLRSGSEPIVSLYLDVRWGDEQQRERVRLFVHEKIRKTLGHYLPDSPGYDELERTLSRVQRYVQGLTAQTYETDKNGLALFACETLNLWRTHYFRRPFQPELCTDFIPHLTQLARLADDYEPAIVIAPTQEGAELYRVTLGALAVQERLPGFVPRREEEEFNPATALHGQHYEREEKDARPAEADVQRNRKRAAEEAVQLFDHTPGAHLVMVGPAEIVAAFERELPERLRSQVITRIPRPREWDGGDGVKRDGIVNGVAKAIRDREKVSEERAVDLVVGESLRGGLGVLGPDDVVQALNQGRVHRLVLEEDFERSGWRCDNCDALGQNAEAAEVCPYCGGDLHAVQHLGEALVARALAEGGEVEVVAHTNKLHSYKGVGAFLRQTGATGLRGASQPWPTAPGANRS